jgi:hypothetical protein
MLPKLNIHILVAKIKGVADPLRLVGVSRRLGCLLPLSKS